MALLSGIRLIVLAASLVFYDINNSSVNKIPGQHKSDLNFMHILVKFKLKQYLEMNTEVGPAGLARFRGVIWLFGIATHFLQLTNKNNGNRLEIDWNKRN